MEEKEKKQTREEKNWLQKLQQGSWEPEILISGIVLYGLFNVYPKIDELSWYLEFYGPEIFSNSSVNDNLTALLKFANILLIIGFISHLLFRSVWAAFIGLSYVYKEGIRWENLRYPHKYLRHIKKGADYVSQINLLEEISSMLFSISFLVFMWVLGLSTFFLIFAAGISLYIAFFPASFSSVYIDTIITSLCLLFLVDFLSLGWLKRIPYVRVVYYPFYRVFSWLSLSIIYRNIYYGIISNHKKWKVSLVLFLFVLTASISVSQLRKDFSFLGSSIKLEPMEKGMYRMDPSHYRSRAAGDYSSIMHTDSPVVKGNFLELFIVHTSAHEDRHIWRLCNYLDEYVNEGYGFENDSLKMKCLSEFYKLELDGEELPRDYIYYSNAITKQDGLLTYIDVSDLEVGKHSILIFYQFYNREKDEFYFSPRDRLFFYKQ
jgi:hypothetical protein